MFKESRISCPYCNEQIMQDAKKCPICKEWIKKEPPKQEVKTTSEEAKTHKTSSIIKLPIFFVVIGLGISFGIYEYNSHKILSYADSVNEEGLYETAGVAYGKILEDYEFSIATVRANQQVGNPDYEYQFPLKTAWVCTFVLWILMVIKICRRTFLVGTIFLFVITGSFLIILTVAYGNLEIQPLEEIATELMKNPQVAFYISYALIFFTGIAILSNPKSNRS